MFFFVLFVTKKMCSEKKLLISQSIPEGKNTSSIKGQMSFTLGYMILATCTCVD